MKERRKRPVGEFLGDADGLIEIPVTKVVTWCGSAEKEGG